MSATIQELIHLVLRWMHLIAGILWIGNSMLFNWLDRNLEKEGSDPNDAGDIWLLHSGGFYYVRKLFAIDRFPSRLHWFWIQATLTWVTGFSLLILVYYMGGAAFLIDRNVSDLSPQAAVLLGIGVLVGGFVIYDVLWRLAANRFEGVANVISLALVGLTAWGLTRVFSGRGAYIHVGALLGTLMVGNVWLHILPSQRQQVAAAKKGELADKALSMRAKRRSIHNNYMTYPVLFIMLSSHFPATYGNALNWLVLAVIMVGGAMTRHILNIRFHTRHWVAMLVSVLVIALVLTYILIRPPSSSAQRAASVPHEAGETEVAPVTFAEARDVVHRRCIACHSIAPTDPLAAAVPAGIHFDTPDQIRQYADRIFIRAVETKTMPMANTTGMSDEERDILGRWYQAGAAIP